MNRGYLKNVYIQQIDNGNYLDGFKDSLEKVSSLTIINLVIEKMIEFNDENIINELISIFLLRMEIDITFFEKIKSSYVHMILFRIRLNQQTFEKLKLLYEKIEIPGYALGEEEIAFFSDSFYNYYLYKVTYKNYTFDIPIDCSKLGPNENMLFMKLLKDICIMNRGNESLLEYVLSIPQDMTLYKAILSSKYKIDISRLTEEDIYFFYPSQIRGASRWHFVKPYLCNINSISINKSNNLQESINKSNNLQESINRNNNLQESINLYSCKICGKNVVEIDCNIDMDEYINTVLTNGEDLYHLVSHYIPSRTPFILKSVLKLGFQSAINFEILKYFKIVEGSEEEDIIIRLVKSMKDAFKIGDYKNLLRAMPYLLCTPKIIFSYFVALFEGFIKYEKQSLFMRDLIKNLVCRNLDKFLVVKPMIFEYYITNLSTFCIIREYENSNIYVILEAVFERLSFFFDEDVKYFVEENMYYIYPLIYNNDVFVPYLGDTEYTTKNIKFLFIHLFLNNEENKIKIIGYNDKELKAIGVDIIVPLFCNNYFNYRVLSKFFGKVEVYISKNLSKFLFSLKTEYCRGIYEFKTCIFKIVRNVLDSIGSNVEMLFSYIFPFVEFFLEKHINTSKCNENCRKVFIDYFLSLFKKKNISVNFIKLFPYLDDDKVLEWCEGDGYFRVLNAVSSLLDYKGSIYLEKAIKLLYNNNSEEEFMRSMISGIRGMYKSKILEIHRKLYNSSYVIGYYDLSSNIINNTYCLNSNESNISSLSVNSVAKAMVENYLFDIDLKKQDLHFFVIQETIKHLTIKLDDSTESMIEQFRNTQYFYEYNFNYEFVKIYDKTYNYRRFLNNLYQYMLYSIRDRREYFELLKYGNMFDVELLEFSCMVLIRVSLEYNIDDLIFNIISEIVRDLDEGIDRSISKFVIKLYEFIGKKFFSFDLMLKASLFLKNYYLAIQLLENRIRNNKGINESYLLMYCYYSIKDYDKTKGINNNFSSFTSINLFFNFCMENNYLSARKCLLGINLCIGEYDYTHLLEDLLEDCEDDDISKFMEDCKIIEKNFCHWKTFKSRNDICLHFVKDCELISKSNDLSNTLELITDRRELANNNSILVELHKILSRSLFNSRIYTPVSINNVGSITNITNVGSTNNVSNVGSITNITNVGSTNNVSNVGSITNVSNVGSINNITNVGNITINSTMVNSSIENFERNLRLKIIENYRKQGDYNNAIKEIGNLLLKQEWSVFLELAEVNILQDNLRNAKMYLKKILNLFPEKSEFYRKALIRYSELVDTKIGYKDALKVVSDSSKLYLLAAKKYEETEPGVSIDFYINAIDEYSDEVIPRIFHLYSELTSNREIKSASIKIRKFVEKNLKILPEYYSQIISKITHPDYDISMNISEIIYELMENFPFETYWYTLSTLNSHSKDTSNKAENIVKKLSFDNRLILTNLNKITEHLSDIAKSKKNELSMSKDFPGFFELLPSEINIPNTKIKIESVDEEIKVFHSLQSPKRIAFLGTDGKKYLWLCKHQDDLRKDTRFMDLNLIINKIFRKQSSKNYVRTYTVIPFSHNSGIIEWIDGLNSLKEICNNYYSKIGISLSETARAYIKKRRVEIRNWNTVIEKLPPVFHLWFKDKFPQPYNWYVARNNYITTYAVMNIIGWFMGLGDRHAENILFDSNTGDTVHVDLNCIFDKGKTLEIPELVPFRLTQNIVDAFGVMGLEGSYNTVLYETLDLFLKNRSILISNLLSFVYDPLFEWKRRKPQAPKNIIDDLYAKLEDLDIMSKCDTLNEEASKDENLAKMYIGWLPFV